jgi:hypothetical protein
MQANEIGPFDAFQQDADTCEVWEQAARDETTIGGFAGNKEVYFSLLSTVILKTTVHTNRPASSKHSTLGHYQVYE